MNTECKTKRILATSALVAAALAANTALGDGPRRMIGVGNNQNTSYPNAIAWSAEDGGDVILPGSEGSDACVYVLQPYGSSATQIRLKYSSSFPDVQFELDNPGQPIKIQSGNVNIPRITVKGGGKGVVQNGVGTTTLNGGWTIDSGAVFPIASWNSGNGSNTANLTFISSASSSLSGAADSVLSYQYTALASNASQENGMTVDSTFTIGVGDASGFKGKYVIDDPYSDAQMTTLVNNGYTARTHIKFVSATAFGDPTATKANAVTLGEGAYLSLGAGVAQYATRGVTIAADKKGGVEAGSGDSWTLTAPVTCESGATFAKVGAGTVTIDGDCTGISAIEVTEGTLVLSALGSFANGLAVMVKSGATLVQNKYVGNIAVMCEEGGTWTQDIQYVVPYSDATGASTPLDFTAAVPALPLSIRLTESVEIASFAGNGYTAKRIDVARLPLDTTATAADFTDATEKYCGLPKTSFEIESREGFKALVLVAKPVVWSIGTVGDNKSGGGGYGINGNVDANPWSYGTQAQPGYDYLVTNYVRGTGYYVNDAPDFNGDSLTFYDETSLPIALTSGNVDFGDATYCGNVEIYYNASSLGGTNSRKPFTGITHGTATIAAGANLTLETRQSDSDSPKTMTNCMTVAVSGEGNLVATSGKLKNTTVTYCISGGAPVYLTGDNSDFKGKIIVTCTGSPTETDGTTLHLGTAASFGGAMAAATADGLLLEKYGFLYPEQTMTLNAANRGITIASGGFDVPEGVAFTVSVPLTVNGAAIKKGSGELALGGAATFTSGTFTVKEGAVRALSDDAVAGDFVFADGTTIVLDPGAGLVNGFTGTFAVTGEGTPKVTVAIDTASASFDRDGAATLPICTVPATAADLTGSFTVAPTRGCDATLVKEAVTVGGVECYRYGVHTSKRGTVIYMR